LLHQLDAQNGVLVEEAARIQPIRPDAADDRREVDDHLGPAIPEGSIDPGLSPEVVLGRPGNEELIGTAFG
jgi:hypothetical protein